MAVEIAATHVAAATMTFDRGEPRVTGQGCVGLPEGAVTPQVTATNVTDRGVVEDAVRRAIGQLPRRPHRVGLTIPDTAGKVSLVPFDTVPGRAADLERLVAWQVRKAAPFRVEDAQLTYAPGAKHGEDGREFVVALVRRDIVEEYETVCAAAGVHAGIVDLTSFNLVNAALAATSPEGADWLLVHVAPGYTTLAIVRDGALIFFRTRPTSEGTALSDLVHQTTMYYEDHLDGRVLDHVVLADTRWPEPDATMLPLDEVRAILQDRLGVAVHQLPQTAGGRTDGSDAGRMPSCLGGPIGLLVRERAEVA